MSKSAPLSTVPSAGISPARAPTTLMVEDVTKLYKTGTTSIAALNRVSLEIRTGELTVLAGPSGSGKTTLLSIMGGILRPTSGEVVICGQAVADMSEADRSNVRLKNVGFVFQSYGLFPALTACQNVEIALELKGSLGRKRRHEALELLDEMGLLDKASAYPADLSGGQKQRVAVARALAGAPAIVLADEPTAALDSVNGRRIMKAFHDLARLQNRTVVIVTHDSRIIDLADRVVRIEDGHINGDELVPQNTRPASITSAMIRRPSHFEAVWAP
jgi:putative ABC transport system ATP-binding protein